MIIDWQKIDTVMLDMDGTILDLHYDNYFWQVHLPALFAQKNAMTLEQANAHLQPIFRAKEGQLEWYCIDYWSEQFRIDIAQEKRDQQVAKKIRFRESAEEFLNVLKAKGITIWMVTNAHRKVVEIKSDILALDQYFDEKISSHDYGFAKEQQQFWESFKQHKPFNPETSLFIDDSYKVLKSAEKYGIAHLRGILQPDSKGELSKQKEFKLITDFTDLALNNYA